LILINDADYQSRFVSIPRPGCRVGELTTDGDGGPADIRGRIADLAFKAPPGGCCAGTYNVSVALMDLGRAGTLGHKPAPFGSATFTVKP
jgi:hypothetical protein